MYSWFEALGGLVLIGIGSMVALIGRLPGPRWLWGEDADLDVLSPARQASARASLAMGGGLIALAALAAGTPGDLWGIEVALLLFGWSVACNFSAQRSRDGSR